MPYFAPEVIAEANKLDLLTYLKNYEPNELVRINENNYKTKTHSSLKISNGLWNWFSRGIGGKSAIDYLIKVKGYSFIEAVEIIVNKTKIQTPIIYRNEQKIKEKEVLLPKKLDTNNRIISYLKSRGISENIIRECIKNNLMYEDVNHNIVFLGYDENKEIKYASCRATNNSRYMHDIKGSSKMYSFRLKSSVENNAVHLFESAIDLLSYATFFELNNMDYKKVNLLSLSGVYQPAQNISQSKVPVALKNYLDNNTNIDTIILHFDNDMTGKKMAEAFQNIMGNEYKVINNPPKKGKDYNDYLLEILKEKNNKKYERVR